jgi:hypothetical protein
MSDGLLESDVDVAFESRYAFPIRTYPAAELKGLKTAGKAVDRMKRLRAATDRDRNKVAHVATSFAVLLKGYVPAASLWQEVRFVVVEVGRE